MIVITEFNKEKEEFPTETQTMPSIKRYEIKRDLIKKKDNIRYMLIYFLGIIGITFLGISLSKYFIYEQRILLFIIPILAVLGGVISYLYTKS